MGLFDAFRHRVFRRFFAGQAVSQMGDGVFFVAISWQALQFGGDGQALGLVLTAFFTAQVALLLVGGLVVDRFSRQSVVVASDVAQGVLAAVVAALAFTGSLSLGALLVLAALFGAAASVATPALSAFVPETVPRASLGSAQSLFQSTRTLAFFLGPLVGAGLIKLGGTWSAFAVNAATFAVSATLLASLGRLPSGAEPARGVSILADLKEGARYVSRLPWLWMTVLAFTLVNFAENGPRTVSLPVLLTDVMDQGVEALGYSLSALTLGSFVGLMLAGHFMPGRRRGLVAFACTGVSGAFILLTGLAQQPWATYVLMGIAGAAMAAFGIIWETTLGQAVAPRMRGRVASLDLLGSFALLPVSAALAGWATGVFGPRAALVAGGALVVAAALFGLLVPAAHAFPHEAPRVEAPADAPEVVIRS